MRERGISPVIGVIVLVVIAVLLVVVTGYAVLGVSENALGTAALHSQSNYEVDIENDRYQTLVMDLKGHREQDPDTEFILSINGNEIDRWEGKGADTIEVECLYPGDEVQLVSANGDTTVLAEEFEVERPTACTRYNSFEDKFPNAVVNGDSYQVRENYDFGLSINPNGDESANGQDIGKISLQNPWHHIEVYEDRSIGGLEPPVFLIVMVDNVHYNNVPDPNLHQSVSQGGSAYDWDTNPPAGLNPGSESFEVESDGSVTPIGGDDTEPTNDIYIVFQPGCDQSTVKFVAESAGFDNEIYKDGELVIPNTNAANNGETFSAPGTDCPNGGEWR